MTVKELIEHLRELPPDAIVYRDIEGEFKTIRNPRLADLHTWSVGGSIHEDYMSHYAIDNDEAKFKAVVLD